MKSMPYLRKKLAFVSFEDWRWRVGDWSADTCTRSTVYVFPLNKYYFIITDRDNGGNITFLMIASYFNHVEVVERLLASGAKCNAVDDLCRENSLHLASERGCSAIIKLLLDHDRSGINARNNAGLSPIDIAIMMRHQDIVKSLIIAGAKIAEDNFGLEKMPLLILIQDDKSGKK